MKAPDAVQWLSLPMAICLPWVDSRLSWDDPLSLALRGLNFESGAFSTIAPPGFTVASPEDLDAGLELIEENFSSAAFRMFEWLWEAWQSTAYGVLLLCSDAQVSDPVGAELATRSLALGPEPDDFLCLVLDRTAGRSDLETALRECRAFSGYRALTVDPDRILRPDRRVLEGNEVRRLAGHVRVIVFEAFDGFGYVVWTTGR